MKTPKNAEQKMTCTPAIVKCAVGIVFNEKQEILIAERPSGKSKAGFWEFPGGKVEENETPEVALKRELLEEVGIIALELQAFMQLQFDYPEYSVQLEIFLVPSFSGNPTSLENQKLAWSNIEDLSSYRFLEGNKEIIQSLIQLKKQNLKKDLTQ